MQITPETVLACEQDLAEEFAKRNDSLGAFIKLNRKEVKRFFLSALWKEERGGKRRHRVTAPAGELPGKAPTPTPQHLL
jgi:hypothetical protein